MYLAILLSYCFVYLPNSTLYLYWDRRKQAEKFLPGHPFIRLHDVSCRDVRNTTCTITWSFVFIIPVIKILSFAYCKIYKCHCWKVWLRLTDLSSVFFILLFDKIFRFVNILHSGCDCYPGYLYRTYRTKISINNTKALGCSPILIIKWLIKDFARQS